MQKQQQLRTLTEQSQKPKRHSWNPLAKLSAKAQERSSRLAGMESEKKDLQARLKALEAESVSLKGQISERESEWQSLTEGCLDFEDGIASLSSDLEQLSYE